MLLKKHQIPPSSADANIVTDIEENCNTFCKKILKIRRKIELFRVNRGFLWKKAVNLDFSPEIFGNLPNPQKVFFYSSERKIRAKRESEKTKRESEEAERRRR